MDKKLKNNLIISYIIGLPIVYLVSIIYSESSVGEVLWLAFCVMVGWNLDVLWTRYIKPLFKRFFLCQMGSQRTFLNSKGVETKQNNVYPCVKESDVTEALRLIWTHKVEGWWHYQESYVKYSICTKEEFIEYLNR